MKKPMNFIEMGEYYGYPPCCIAEFIEFVLNYSRGGMDERGKRKFNGTGYVPCVECNKKSVEELLATISANRKCETTFPEDDYGIPGLQPMVKRIKKNKESA